MLKNNITIKNAFILMMLTCTQICLSQVFDHKSKVDKFNDAISFEAIKTLVSINDSIITIEEKGKKAQTFYILGQLSGNGSNNNKVNVSGNFYGYDEEWLILNENQTVQFYLAQSNFLSLPTNSASSEQAYKEMLKHELLLAHRVIYLNQYSDIKIYEYIILTQADNLGMNERVVYSRRIY